MPFQQLIAIQQASTRETRSGTRTDTTSNWREFAGAINLDGELERLAPDELDYVTMAVTLDVSDLSPPRVNWMLSKAEQFERQFTSKAWGMGAGVSNEEPSERLHADGRGFEWIDAETVWMDVTVDVSDLDSRETSRLIEEAEGVENEFLGDTAEYVTFCA